MTNVPDESSHDGNNRRTIGGKRASGFLVVFEDRAQAPIWSRNVRAVADARFHEGVT